MNTEVMRQTTEIVLLTQFSPSTQILWNIKVFLTRSCGSNLQKMKCYSVIINIWKHFVTAPSVVPSCEDWTHSGTGAQHTVLKQPDWGGGWLCFLLLYRKWYETFLQFSPGVSIELGSSLAFVWWQLWLIFHQNQWLVLLLCMGGSKACNS